jgi:DNA-binding NarL/FixJ family response regulator
MAMLTQRQSAPARLLEPAPPEEDALLPRAAPPLVRWAAAQADAASSGATFLAENWQEFVSGAWKVAGAFALGDRTYLVARSAAPGERLPLTPTEAAVVARVLCGEQQKAIAADLGIAPSTASHRCMSALRKLGAHGAPVPLPLVVAAEHASGLSGKGARSARFECDGGAYIVLSVRRPDMRRARALTRAEQEVASLFVEGLSRSEIAQARGTSVLTVAGQVHSIFAALRLSGRYALVRRAGEIGCFEVADSR